MKMNINLCKNWEGRNVKNYASILMLAFVAAFQCAYSATYKVGEAWGANKNYSTLQELITAGAGKAATDEIWIAGTQELDAQWVLSTWQGKVYGGFAGTETSVSERAIAPNGRGWDFVYPTTLKLKTRTDGNSIIVSKAYASAGEIVTLIDGIRFDATNCTASPVWFRQFSSSGITIRNCVVENADLATDNTLSGGTNDYEAGGINLGSDDAVNVRNVVIEECLIQN
ncbi:MAG: hypothetical protein LBR34_03300, partial [Prevotella sp.]|nr:hypothetical protein [Prevotella sp.]